MIIQIIGLPGSGKSSLAAELARRTDAIRLNADDVRGSLSTDLGYSIEDRVENSRRLGALAKLLSDQGKLVIVDYINPSQRTRDAFGYYDYRVWVDRILHSRFEDTDAIWESPEEYDLRIQHGKTVEEEAELVLETLKIHDWTKPTTLMLGRYQPWHEGHRALYDVGLTKTSQVLVGVRNTEKTSPKDPLGYRDVERYIKSDVPDALILKLPNITNIIYGRDVGYKIEHVELSPELQQISATQKRKEMGI